MLRVPFKTYPNGEDGSPSSVFLLDGGQIVCDQFRPFFAKAENVSNLIPKYLLLLRAKDTVDITQVLRIYKYPEDGHYRFFVDFGCAYSGSSNNAFVTDPEEIAKVDQWVKDLKERDRLKGSQKKDYKRVY